MVRYSMECVEGANYSRVRHLVFGQFRNVIGLSFTGKAIVWFVDPGKQLFSHEGSNAIEIQLLVVDSLGSLHCVNWF